MIRRKTTKILIEEEAQGVNVDINMEQLESINSRMRDYSLAANYCNKLMKNKQLALMHLQSAEKLKDLSNKYKTDGVLDEAKMVGPLTAEILFNCSESDRVK